MKVKPYFRNDDVSYDTQMEYFPQFCGIFHKHGFTQVHAVTLRGLCNYANYHNGSYCVYEGHQTLSQLDNERIRKLSMPYRLEDNEKLVRYLSDTPDEVALHGLYHTNYARMTENAQYEEMKEGLALLRKIFPQKRVRFFVPPFNSCNLTTHRAAGRLGLTVVGDEGVHLEESLTTLRLFPGVWYRYHHHRFYPGSTFGNPSLTLENLDQALGQAALNPCTGPLPVPSFNYEGDLSRLKELVKEHNAQEWFVGTAQNRLQRRELILAMAWIYSRIGYGKHIFEIGCGSGNNLLWLAQHGYEHLGGSDTDAAALAVAAGMADFHGFTWNLGQGSLFDPEHIPEGTDLLIAVNCLSFHTEFDLRKFLSGCKNRLSPTGCILVDQVDASFNGHPLNAVHSKQWGLPPEERSLPSEYCAPRITMAEARDAARRSGMHLVAALPSLQQPPRVIYIFSCQPGQPEMRGAPPALPLPEAMVQPTVQAIFLSGLFDWAWYRKQYVRGPEVMDPLEHYVRFGASKGYWPNPDFDSGKYRRKHMNMMDSTNPLLHSLLYIPCSRKRKES
ncbi:methyltransferase domain-containing protein [Desulfovibrio sp. ZJ200]|uniref:methyltransferase domain-containing protein n=1 Tax=Desulfovibrio sp. ZJ200 TaxID=2709792 RepID=UPI0013EAB1FC|nr:methyltransferase domain-containing protein [Desulfovibrio sp. ZJ200]